VLNVVIWLLESATEYGYSLMWRNLAQTVEHEARMDAYAHVQRLELTHFEETNTGGLMSILNDDVDGEPDQDLRRDVEDLVEDGQHRRPHHPPAMGRRVLEQAA
jgi:hypothetical protein